MAAKLDDLEVRRAILYAVGSICDDEGACVCVCVYTLASKTQWTAD